MGDHVVDAPNMSWEHVVELRPCRGANMTMSWNQGVSWNHEWVSWGTCVSWRGVVGTSYHVVGHKHVVEACRGQHAFLKGVVGTLLACRGVQGVVEGCRGDQCGGVVGNRVQVPFLYMSWRCVVDNMRF